MSVELLNVAAAQRSARLVREYRARVAAGCSAETALAALGEDKISAEAERALAKQRGYIAGMLIIGRKVEGIGQLVDEVLDHGALGIPARDFGKALFRFRVVNKRRRATRHAIINDFHQANQEFVDGFKLSFLRAKRAAHDAQLGNKVIRKSGHRKAPHGVDVMQRIAAMLIAHRLSGVRK